MSYPAAYVELFKMKVTPEDFEGILSVWDSLPDQVRKDARDAVIQGLTPPPTHGQSRIRDEVRGSLHFGTPQIRRMWPDLTHQAQWNLLHVIRRHLSDSRPFKCQFPSKEAMCWNYMTPRQQLVLRANGRIEQFPWINGYGGGSCNNKAEVAVTIGEMPGPRFYCQACAKDFPSNIVAPLPEVG